MIRTTSAKALLALAILLSACSRGDSANAPEGADVAKVAASAAAPRAVAPSTTLATGTAIATTITNEISSRNGAAGDVFTAVVTADVLGARGVVLIPSGSTVSGSIVEVSSAPNDRSLGSLTLAVSSVMINGSSYPIDASIESLNTVQQSRGVEGSDVARVAGGAAAGSIIGQVIGRNTKGTVVGGVIGAAAGAAVSALGKDQDIVLPAGSSLNLTLRQPLKLVAAH